MTLLQELQARILAKISSAAESEPGEAYILAELSSQIVEPEISGPAPDPQPPEPDSRTTGRK